MSVRPLAAVAISLASAVALFILSPQWSGTLYAVLLALLLLIAMRNGNAGLGKRLLAWTAPFLLPLLLVHGILNAQFSISFWLLDIIPIRETGLAFGYDLAVRVFTFSVVGAYWLSVDRDRMVEALISLRLPTALIMMAMQGFVMSRLVKDRIDAIYLAQRARGIPLSASFRQRIAALPALLLPVVVGTFVEAEARIPVLLSHGYGRLNPRPQPEQIDRATIGLILATITCLAIATATEFAL